MATAFTLIVQSRRARAIVAATIAMLEGRISQEELERRNRAGEQMDLDQIRQGDKVTRGQK
jgi:hypothetical protein